MPPCLAAGSDMPITSTTVGLTRAPVSECVANHQLGFLHQLLQSFALPVDKLVERGCRGARRGVSAAQAETSDFIFRK